MAKKTQYQPTGLPGQIKTFAAKEEAVVPTGDDALHRSQFGSDFRRERQLTDDGRM